ncbi:uncharacterized protein LOC133447017 isoform X2 [Cololabis saira]|uniref:uncharacterized protein LOC133447017 isoform X2 n=1 Tax=Cololabis saira TaxID=129043 RepID=UPI002AD4CC79|nr:uncharacterized protein LOC133447017 isoform X2 [Cololabis saira]
MSDQLMRQFQVQMTTAMDSVFRTAVFEAIKIFENVLYGYQMELAQKGEEAAQLKIKLQRAELQLKELIGHGSEDRRKTERNEPQNETVAVVDVRTQTSEVPEIDFEVPDDWCAPLGTEVVIKQEDAVCPSVANNDFNLKRNSSRRSKRRRISLSRAEQLLKAIADGSEIEDLSDGEDNDPAVAEIVPCEETGEQPDDSESDSDYQPDAAHISEDTDSDTSEPQHKQPHLENDEPDQDLQGRRAGPRKGNGEYWKFAPFNRILVPFQGADEQQDERADLWPVQYMEQYIDIELMKVLADCTNSMSLAKSGRSLNTSVEEMYRFFGASILMSCVPYPQTRMFWCNSLRIPAISDSMRRDRFFKLRSHLKVVIDDDVPEDGKTDTFWKVRPFMNRILKGCHAQARPESVSIDEQTIPFTGACPFRQHMPLKPNSVGMKNFVLASEDGIVLDFEVYQGSKALAAQVPDAEGSGLGALVLKRLTKTVDPGTKVHSDRVLSDRMMSYYRMSVRTKKWTIRMLMHFMDLALANSWLLYRRDQQEHGTPRKAIMTFLEFRMDVAQVFLNKCDVTHAEEESACYPQPGQRSRVNPVPHISVRTTSAAHLPEVANLKNPMRCRQKGCPGKCRVRCKTCNVFLCLQKGRNCYEAFHRGQ